ncbi:MAG: EAL domain-containing protein [Proteobacteria bacterium]|nr:EAL domain-containing protein [Pseudomonadota bacterium]
MRSFRKRLLVLIIGLVIVTQTVTLAAVLASTRRAVEARSADQLRAGGTLAENLISFRAGQLANGVAVLAADFGFREAVASGHAPTILSAARNNAQRIGADLVLVLDTRGQVLASTAPDTVQSDGALQSLIAGGQAARDQPTFHIFGAHAYQVFLAPVRTPDTIAWVLMGFVADQQLALKIRGLVGSEVQIVAHGDDGLMRAAATVPGALAPLPADSGAHVTSVDGREYLGFVRRLNARGDQVDVVLLEPLHEVFAPYREQRDAMLLIDGVALVLAGLVGAILGRGATRPIGELVRAAQRIEKGEYGTAVNVAGGDEFRALASTFNTMQHNIAAREADITYQAQHDPLTRLPNRAFARREIDSSGSPAALVLIELRNLRDINASLGHAVGDEVLREAARRLQQNVAAGEILARPGETQFLVFTPRCSADRALLYGEQLVAAVRAGFHVAGVSLDLRLACGVCVSPEHGRTAEELLQRAQVALEEADEARSRVCVYRAGQDSEHRRRLTLVTDLGTAIEQDALTLVYQPKVDMTHRSVRSLEALVRWTHPQLGAISPAEFVPLAERTGGARRLTRWVLAAAIRQLGAWRREGIELDLAVNLSAPDILDPELGDEILKLLRQHRVDPTRLILEITESAVMGDAQAAVRNMQLLRIAGLRFSLDDFGTGHSSLSQLSVLPVDELKIDRSFIALADSGAVTILTSTIELGHSMGLKVVAEGVEDAAAWNLLRRLGCDYAQGYLISRPLAVEKVVPYVREANRLLPASESTAMQLRVLQTLTRP